MRDEREEILRGFAMGALAGVAATWLMGRATTFLYEREDPEARRREDAARGDRTAYEIAAEKGAGLLGRELSAEQRKRLGSAIHWATGVGSGALYGALRPRLPRGGGWTSGALFGLAVWLLLDEIGNTALGLTPKPAAFPWQAHARGGVGHLVLGLAAEGLLQAADRAA